MGKKKSTETKHIKTGDIIFNSLNYTFFIVFALLCLFPFYYLLINTISDNSLVNQGAISFFPKGIHFKNYIEVFANNSELVKSFLVTISRTVVGTAVMVFASAFVGYLMTKKELWGRKFWYRFIVITMYFNVGMIPVFLTMQMLGLTNNYLVYILPGIVAPYNIVLVKTYIESLPSEMEESAIIDGASFWMIFSKVIWPLCRPILITVAVFGAIKNWNSFQDSLIYMQAKPGLFTLQHVLWNNLHKSSNMMPQLFQSKMNGTDVPKLFTTNQNFVKYTVAMISALPVLVIIPVMAKHLEKGIELGKLKD